MANKNQVPKEPTARSPFAGCAILVVAFLVMIFLVGFSVLTLFRQFNEIAKFTGTAPAPVEITVVENQDAALNALAEKIENFRQALAGDEEVSLELTAEELNMAIAAYEPLKELRGTFRIQEIGEETMRIAISFPLNGKPRFTREDEAGWITSDSRYLNGTLIARPELQSKEIVLALDTIEVPSAAVPREFIEQMSPYRITERYMADPVIGPEMAKLTRASISNGKVVLTRNPNENPANQITDSQVDAASKRFFTALGVAASIFLAIVGLILFIGMRAKARKARES